MARAVFSSRKRGLSAGRAWLLAVVAGAVPATVAEARVLDYVGVNLSGAEYNGRKLPGKFYTDYVYPSPELIDYFLARGMNSFRLPFLWERVQPSPGGELDAGELARIDAVVAHVGAKGGFVILDPHNYARHAGNAIGSEALPPSMLADLWRRLAGHYRSERHVIFGLMNEPHAIEAEVWFAAAQGAINAIRKAGAANLILVPGTRWTGAHSWFSGGDMSNAAGFEKLSDPGRNMAVEVHQYLDANFSGTGRTCRSSTVGKEVLAPVTAWLRKRGYRGFLGEFGASANPGCLTALDNILSHVAENGDVWLGWTYWAAGQWLGRYPFSVSPTAEGDAPQMRVLVKYGGKR